MISFVKGISAGIIGSRKFAAATHVPIIGALLCMAFGVLLVKRWRSLKGEIKLGVAAQLVFPLIFAIGSTARYFIWFFGFEGINIVLFYALSAYMIAAYLCMIFSAYSIASGRDWLYGPLRPFLERFVERVFR